MDKETSLGPRLEDKYKQKYRYISFYCEWAKQHLFELMNVISLQLKPTFIAQEAKNFHTLVYVELLIKVLIIIQIFSLTAFHRGYMHKCYHQGCDTVTNPDLNPQTIHFGGKITQALTLALADLSGGLDKCDLSHLKLKPVDYEPISINDILDYPMPSESSKTTPSPSTTAPPVKTTTQTPTTTTTTTTTRALPTTQATTIKEIISTTTMPPKTSPQTTSDVPESLQASSEFQQHEASSTFRWISLIHSILAANQPKLPRTADLNPIDVEPKAYQPNYGNQYNIDKLTFNMNAPAYVNKPAEKEEYDDYGEEEESFNTGPLFIKTEDDRPLGLVVPPSKPKAAFPETDILSYLARFLQGDQKPFRRRKHRKSAALRTSPMFIKLAM